MFQNLLRQIIRRRRWTFNFLLLF